MNQNEYGTDGTNGRGERRGRGGSRNGDARQMMLTTLEPRLLYSGVGHGDDLHIDFPAAMDPVATQETVDAQGSGVAAGPVSGGVPAFNSKPGAAARIIIDFDGAVARSWGSYSVPATPAYDQDGDPTTFNTAELASINEIVLRVAEKFSPFDVNVTTVDDGGPYLNKEALKIVVGGTGSWVGAVTGGVAYIGGFYNSSDNVGWVFPGNLSNGFAKYTAEAVAHEAGHAFGLQHQSVWTGSTLTHEYNPGTSATAPTMGVSYYATRGLWWTGTPSTNSTGTQADLTTLSNASNGFGYRADDHGGTTGAATALTVLGNGTFTASGVVERSTDADYFGLTMGAGRLTLTLGVAQHGAMLDGSVHVYDANGTLVASAATGSLGETLTVDVAGGSYFVRVTGAGGYGDIGQYSISGEVVAAIGPVSAPGGLTATPVTAGRVTLTWTDQSNNEAGFIVQRSVDGTTWVTVATVSPNVTSYNDDTVGGATTYQYRVRGYNGDGESANTSVATATTVPAAPSGMSVALTSATQVTVSWNGVTGTTGYLIERSLDGTSWSEVGSRSAGVTTYVDSGLSAGVRYYYRVRANSAAGASAYSATENRITPPGVPTGVAGSAASANQVGLTWNAVTGAELYEVDRSADGATWSLLGTSLTGGYTDTDLAASTRYHYRVRAVNESGNSAYATTVDVLTAPAAPTLLTVVAGSAAQMNLTWSAVTGATSYAIERSLNGTTWSAVTTTAGTTFGDTGLTAATRYYYRVRAGNAGGNSVYSSTLNAFTLTAAPATLTATATSTSQVNLAWAAVSGATSYAIQRSTDGSNWSALATATLTTYSNTGASAGTTYYYRVSAVNASGSSAFSPTASALTMPAAPGTPTATVTESAVTLTWSAVTGASSYTVERSVDGVWTVVGTPTAATYTHTGLASGTQYSYRVRASNATGNSAYSGTRTPLTLPAMPGSLAVAADSTTQIVLSWAAVTGATSYVVDRSTNNSTWTQVSSGAGTTFTNTGLTAGTGYYYRVRAVNASGSSAYALSGQTFTLPAAPAGVAATTAATQVTLTWGAVTGAAGYSVERSVDGASWAVVGSPAAATYADTGLTASTQYLYRVRANNASGASAYSSTLTAMTVPAAPATTTATPVSATQVTVGWSAVTGATSYAVERSPNGTTWTQLTTTGSTSHSDTTAAAGTQYYYRVRASNAGGASAYGATATALTVPAAPAGLSVVSTSSTAVTLNWTSVTGAASYAVERSVDGTAWTSVGTTAGTTLGNSGLSAGAVYYFRVRAVNATGGSAYIATTNATTAPATPTGLAVASVTSTGVNLSWITSTSTTTYTVQRSPNGTTWATVGTTIVGVTTFADATASPLTTYYYRVTASNPIGSSAPSGSVQAVTAPAAPVVSAVDVSVAGRVGLTWGVVSGAVSYAVERSVDGTNWAGVGGGAGTTFQDTSVAAGAVYSYRVRAVGSSNNSDYGSVATALTIAAVPGGLTAEPVSAGQVNLAWGSVTGAATYRVERSANGVDWSVVGTTAGTTMSDGSVSGGVTYSYRLASVNASGTSAYSGLAAALTAPNQPTGLVAASADSPVVTLSWPVVTGAAGYQVERSVVGSGAWTIVGTVGTTGFVDEGLFYETSYVYRIRATNVSGMSAYSAAANVTTPNVPIVLVSPTGLVASEPTSGGATLTWQDNSDNEVGFQIQRSGDGGQTWATVGLAAAGVTTYEDTTLAGGTAYQYRVRAYSGIFTSVLSEVASVTTKPAAPIGVKVTTVSVSRLGVSWAAATGATSYEVERSADGETGWVTVAIVGGTSYEDPHLLGGTRQYYRVRALSGVGASGHSAVGTNVTIPAAPAFLVAIATPDGPVGLAWAAVTGAGEYLIERSEDGVNWSQLVTTGEGIHMDTQVSAGTVYQYRARALGEAGASGTTTSAAVVTAPPVPVDPYALPLADGQINVSWVPVAGASAFVVERSADGVSWDAVGTTEVNSYTDTGLTAKTRYFYRTRAINAAGTSDASAPIEAVTLQAAPDAPSALSLTPVSSDTVRLNWQDNSANESGFRVEYSRNNGKTWLLAGNLPANTSSVQVTGLEAGDNYRFRVSAYNEMGLSRRSNAISGRALGGKPGTQPGSRVIDVQNVKQAMPGLTKKLLPDAATKVTARAYSTSAVQLTWKDNADNELGYRIEFSLDGRNWQIAGHTAADQTGCRVTNLQKGKTYHFRVRAYNLAGDASRAATAKVSVPTRAPVGAKGKPSFESDQDTTLNVLRVGNSVPGVTKALTKALKVRMLRAA